MITLGIKKHIEQLAVKLPQYFDAIALANTAQTYSVYYDLVKDLYLEMHDRYDGLNDDPRAKIYEQKIDESYAMLKLLEHKFKKLNTVPESMLRETTSPTLIKIIAMTETRTGISKIIY